MSFFVVPWNPGYYPDIDEADESQKRCYESLKLLWANKKYIDISDNDAYLYYYNIELNHQLREVHSRTELEWIWQKIDTIIRLYLNEKPKVISYFFNDFIFVNMLLYYNNNNAKALYNINRILYYSTNRNGGAAYPALLASAYVSVGNMDESSYIDPSTFQSFTTNSLRTYMTKIGKEHEQEVLQKLYEFLEDDFGYSGRNFLFNMFDFKEGTIAMDWHGGYECVDVKGISNDSARLLRGVKVPICNEIRIKSYIKACVREAENIFRSSSGIKQIGEGWVSETILFRQVEAMLPDLEVEQHARPSFLGKQHYDVYIPKFKIALEYQGDQHFSSISFFGGEEALIKNRERDERKRSISKKNGVHQIDVKPGYLVNDLFEELKEVLENRCYSVDENSLNRMKSISKRKKSTDTASVQKSANRVSASVKKSLKEDEILTKKALYIISKAKIKRAKLRDPYDVLPRKKMEEYTFMYQDTYPRECFDPHRAIKDLNFLIDNGFTFLSAYCDLARRYDEVKDYRMELLTLLRAQKNYGWNLTDIIKEVIKKHGEEFEDLLAGFESED